MQSIHAVTFFRRIITAPGIVGDFQSKCVGPTLGKGGENIMEMLAEVCTRVDLVSLK